MIVAVAIKRKGVIWTLPKPARHHNVIWAMCDVDNNSTPDKRPTLIHAEGEQGFIDDAGTFHDRKQAAIIAQSCGQLTKPLIAPPNLFSEDLW